MIRSFALVRVLGKDRHDFNTSDYNIGLRYLESIIKDNGHDCDIYDPYDFSSDNGKLFSKKKYSIVGLSVHILNIEESLSFVNALKASNPEVYIILGGHHVTSTATEILTDYQDIDAICHGEGEDVINKIAKNAKTNVSLNMILPKGVLKPEKYFDLEKLEFPSIPNNTSIARLSTSRGCPFFCSFCTTPKIYNSTNLQRYRSRSANNIFAEIEKLNSYGYRKLKVNDDIFILPNKESHKRIKNLSLKLIEAKIRVPYEAETRVDAFNDSDEGLINTIKKGGLNKLFLGIESGSDKILKEFNKGITFKQIQKAIRLYDKNRIVLNAGNILVSSDCGIDDIRESIMGFKKLNLAYFFFRRVTFHVHCFPGTNLELRLERENRLEKKRRYLYRSYKFKESRIEDVVNLFEGSMLHYLDEIGKKIFQKRVQILNRYHNKNSSPAPVDAILSDFNNKAAEILLKWFKLAPAKMIKTKNFYDDFNAFIEFTKGVYKKLFSLN